MEPIWFHFYRLWLNSTVQSQESSLKESFAICDFHCNLGASSLTEELYWLEVLTEAASWSSLHLVLKGTSEGQWMREGEIKWHPDRVHWVSEGHLRTALQAKKIEGSRRSTRYPDLTWLFCKVMHFFAVTSVCFYSPSSFFFFYSSLHFFMRTGKVVWVLDAAHIMLIQLVHLILPLLTFPPLFFFHYQHCLLTTAEVSRIWWRFLGGRFCSDFLERSFDFRMFFVSCFKIKKSFKIYGLVCSQKNAWGFTVKPEFLKTIIQMCHTVKIWIGCE